MADHKDVDKPPIRGESGAPDAADIAVIPNKMSSITGSVQTVKTYPRLSSSSDRQIKYERAQKCLENAALVSKRIKEHRKATAELLGRPFEDDNGGDTASEIQSTISERTGYSAATDTSTTLSIQEALNIPGISESLANTLKQKELLMERIKQYKEISKRPMKTTPSRKESTSDLKLDVKKGKENADVNQLVNTIKEKENVLSVIQVKMKAMETTILDLQEKINEKDQIIASKNIATTLLSDTLNKKEKDSMALLEDTRQQMIKMQENFVFMETEWKEEKNNLLKQLDEKDDKIANLKEANTILENSRFEISLAHTKLIEEVEKRDKEISQLQEKVQALSQKEIKAVEVSTQKKEEDVEEEKGAKEIANMVELTKKIELLEQLNCQIRQTNKELENKLASIHVKPKTPPTSSSSKKGSPLLTRKGARGTSKKSPWTQLSSENLPQESDKKTNKNESKLESVVQSLNKDILDKEFVISQKDAMITELQDIIIQNERSISELKSQALRQADVVDVGICTDTTYSTHKQIDEIKNVEPVGREQQDIFVDVKEVAIKLKAAEDKIGILTNEIEAANKNMIKVKSNHKLKLKQMQKTIDNFSKVSDANAEIIKLNAELHQLSQKVAELEEEKGNLQLHLVDYDSGRLTESDVYKKMVEMENLAETRLKSISVLEAQKFDLVQELHELRQENVEMEDKLADMSHLQSEQVSTEIKSVQLEEQIDQMSGTIKELELVIENLKLDKEHLEGSVKRLDGEKEELLHKLENYIQENIELTDKLEKLSAEKVSSAESIEIVESLTTQEKLELEEYNKGLSEHKIDASTAELPVSSECQENLEKLVEQSAELNKKIELFTQERQEVMEKMNKINSENESLHQEITELSNQCKILQNNLDILTKEKCELVSLNDELNHQIEELKRERYEIAKEGMEIVKPPSVEETADSTNSEVTHDDKFIGDKGPKGAKTVKQLMKDILKFKNIIKEREAEIGDCQMKILSLEEQQQKHNELGKMTASYELKIKSLTEDNQQLMYKLNNALQDRESEQVLIQYKQAQDTLQQEIQKLHNDYASTISNRDARIQELEALLLEYEKQIFNYGNSLEQKDKEMTEYINQITKLNDVSQKLKSTIELLEEEKAKDPNAELVKTLNKQITVGQKKLNECEDKLKKLEEEKVEIMSLKNALEKKIASLDAELRNLQGTYAEKQCLIKDLQLQQQKHTEEMLKVTSDLKERDEEVHEIKLQLRKESIENEKLRTSLLEKEKKSEEFNKQVAQTKEEIQKLSQENQNLNEKYQLAETKNKELMEKLKKFAASMKKKSSMYTDLENQLHETQKDLEAKNRQIDQLLIQANALPSLKEKLKYAEEELKGLQSQKASSEQQKSQDMHQLQAEIQMLHEQLQASSNDMTKLNNDLNVSQKDLYHAREENLTLKSQFEALNNKLADYELEQKNNINYVTKISTLEAEIIQKQTHIAELYSKFENQEQQLSQVQFGQDAKIQERDLYIESLEIVINKYKSRICRLEESISTMEDRRHTLERKADQLGSQLREKQKAYSEYTSQEDQLVSRLAALIDHDRVVEKQLHEIESENKELQYKVQLLSEENQRLKKSITDVQEQCNALADKANRTDFVESELGKYQTQLRELDANLKRVSHEHQVLLAEKKREIEEIETEFNTQIENAIKEKKILSEKYEKVKEHVTELELNLQECKNNIETLEINIEDLNRTNQDLVENSNKKQTQAPDYTEQYINEINRLNSVVNSKNQEVIDLCNKLQDLQNNIAGSTSSYESKITELNVNLQQSSSNIEHLLQELSDLKSSNEQLQLSLQQKDQEIRRLREEKSVSFEMNIPKTEGLVILSTIEPLREGTKQIDVSSIESQIVTAQDENHSAIIRSEKLQTTSVEGTSGEVLEPIMVAKKAYLCYKEGEENIELSDDPFNSDEGWGLGESEETSDVTPGLTHLTDQIQQLKQQNETLKTDLEASNTKLVKAMKKLKELKANNDMLSNELKISKQMSQSSFLDSAMEDELKISIQELEKKVEDLTADIHKERREKDALRKQNDVLHSANEKLIEMKEKLDNETELWKYKFKEANDKVSSIQWGADLKDASDHKLSISSRGTTDEALKDEITKLEKENDEFQSVIDQLTQQNKELSIQHTNLRAEVDDLNRKLMEIQSINSKQAHINNELTEFQTQNLELRNSNDSLNQKVCNLEIHYNEIIQKYENIKTILTATEDNNAELIEKTRKLEEQIHSLKQAEVEANNKLIVLTSELETTKSKLIWHEKEQNANKPQNADTFALSEKFSAMENYCQQLKHNLDVANNKILQLETDNKNLNESLTNSNKQVDELNAKMLNLNSENDQLLSTVAELRSSISSAVDQRGYEIAELWKQHLTQRETDFQKIEQDLRNELSAFEIKYEQLLDSVQSSSQEETNKLVVMEQVTSLQNKLQDKEDHLRNLQDKLVEVMNQTDMLRSEIEDEKVMYESKLLTHQEEYEKQIKELSEKCEENSKSYDVTYNNLKTELAVTKTNNDELNQQIQELLSKVEISEGQVIELTNQLRMKDIEIYQKTHDYTITLTERNEELENVRKYLVEYEKKIEDLTFEKESELAVLRLKMHEQGQDFERAHQDAEEEKLNLTQELNAKIVECTNLNKKITDLNKILEENTKTAEEMQIALENQELEIVTLKDEISNLLRLSKLEKHVTFASDTKPGAAVPGKSPEELNQELLDPVPRAELDLALYMLHQRDVRCEELTMELTQLLDERDTLQLRLSDSLRSYEELKSKCQATGLDISLGHETVAELPTFSVEREQQLVDVHRGHTSRSSSISDPDGDKAKLQAKLTELRSVKQSRDVRLRQDSEQRQLALRLLSRDVAHLPPEAREQLAQAHHTLSRDSQSTSTVLLNWLRGKSTPKVVHM